MARRVPSVPPPEGVLWAAMICIVFVSRQGNPGHSGAQATRADFKPG